MDFKRNSADTSHSEKYGCLSCVWVEERGVRAVEKMADEQRERIKTKLKALDGISYKDWQIIKHIVNGAFKSDYMKKQKELEGQLKLSCDRLSFPILLQSE